MDAAYEALLLKVARSVIRHEGTDLEDAIQDGWFGLQKALQLYDPAKGPFERFAPRWIRWSIYDGMRRAGPLSWYHRKRVRLGKRPAILVEYHSPRHAELQVIDPHPQQQAREEERHEQVEWLLKQADAKVRPILLGILSDKDQRTIGREMGIGDTAVCRRLQRFRQWVREVVV